MASDRLLLVAGDLGIGQTGEIIVTLIVFLHMLEAEQEKLPLGIAADGSTMNTGLVATVPLTGRRSFLRLRLAPAARTDSVEVF
jgi:hypothetical protein